MLFICFLFARRFSCYFDSKSYFCLFSLYLPLPRSLALLVLKLDRLIHNLGFPPHTRDTPMLLCYNCLQLHFDPNSRNIMQRACQTF